EHNSGCAEWNFDYGFQINGSAVFCSWTEVPLLQGRLDILIECFIQALQDANVAHCAIAADYGPQHHGSFNFVADQSRRICRVHFAYRHWSAHALNGSRSGIQFGKAHDPASARRGEVWHV